MWGATTDLQGCSSGGLPPVDHLGDPQVFLLLEPDAIWHPALFPQSVIRRAIFARRSQTPPILRPNRAAYAANLRPRARGGAASASACMPHSRCILQAISS